MKNRQWTSKEKTQIVLEGLSGKIDISQLCQKYQVSQAQYYKWRDMFLQNCHQSFDVKKHSQKEQVLERQNAKLRSIIGDLTIELKKKRLRTMKRRRSQSTQQRDLELLAMIRPIKTDHPLWGYRRIWAYLKYRQDHTVGINRVYRVMKEQNMIVTPQQRLRARRGPLRSKPRSHRPNHFWGIDMTKIKIAPWGCQ